MKNVNELTSELVARGFTYEAASWYAVKCDLAGRSDDIIGWLCELPLTELYCKHDNESVGDLEQGRGTNA